jgi:hypothetical protein
MVPASVSPTLGQIISENAHARLHQAYVLELK